MGLDTEEYREEVARVSTPPRPDVCARCHQTVLLAEDRAGNRLMLAPGGTSDGRYETTLDSRHSFPIVEEATLLSAGPRYEEHRCD